jgi:hypothetical protein
MRNAVLIGLIMATMVGAAAGAAAHHGWSGYDSEKPLNLTGVIREAGYEHPHGYVKLEVPEKIWLVVLAPPSRMERRGLSQEMLKIGASATVEGYPHRSVLEEMRAERITIDGKTTELR